jgi:hypothetical protein
MGIQPRIPKFGFDFFAVIFLMHTTASRYKLANSMETDENGSKILYQRSAGALNQHAWNVLCKLQSIWKRTELSPLRKLRTNFHPNAKRTFCGIFKLNDNSSMPLTLMREGTVGVWRTSHALVRIVYGAKAMAINRLVGKDNG